MKKLHTIFISVLLFSCASLETEPMTEPMVDTGDTIIGTKADIKITQEAETFVQNWLGKYGLGDNIDITVVYKNLDEMGGYTGRYDIDNDIIYVVTYKGATGRHASSYGIRGHWREFQRGALVYLITLRYMQHAGLSGRESPLKAVWYVYVAKAAEFDSYHGQLQKKVLKNAVKENKNWLDGNSIEGEELLLFQYKMRLWHSFQRYCILHYHNTNGSYINHIMENM